MTNIFHKDYVGDDNHVIHAREYADITARDADTDFQVAANLDRVVKVLSPVNFYALVGLGPTAWLAVSNGGGPVTGPVSSVDEEVAVYDGTSGTVLKGGHGVTIDPTGLITTPGDIKSEGHFISRRGLRTTEVFDPDELPAPSGGVITLTDDHYLFKDNFSLSDRFLIENQDMRIEMDGRLTYTGTGTLFTFNLSDGDRIIIDPVNVDMTGAGAKLIDVTGGTVVIREGEVICSGANQTLGDYRDAEIVGIRNTRLNGFTNGFSFDTVDSLVLASIEATSNGLGTGAFASLDGTPTVLADIETMAVTIGISESVFDFHPFILAPISVTNIVKGTNGEFFKTGTTGSITSFADNSIGATAVTVVDNAGAAQFNAVGHGLVIGEEVTHTGMTTDAHNGLFSVTTSTANTYEIGLTFTATDSGFFATTTTQVNSTAHGLTLGTDVSVFDTVNFGGGYHIFGVQANSFEISLRKAWPGASETGTWDTSSLDETSTFVDAEDNGAQKDSQTICDILVGGNAVATVIATQNVFVDLDLNDSAVKSSTMELFTLTDPDTGEVRYDGLNPISLSVAGVVAASSSGGGQRFDFQLCRNGAALASPDNVDIPIEVGAALNSAPLDWGIIAQPGDLFRLQVQNTEGTSNITIDTLKFTMR